VLTKETALKKLISKMERHSAAVDSAIGLTSKVAWLMISPSMRENDFRARDVARSAI
jgi:hypothetical protein